MMSLSMAVSGGLAAAGPTMITYIPIEAVRPNPYQPRRHFDQHALEELAASIRQYGILQPISVRRQTSAVYELIAGERRLRASKLAGLATIPVIIHDMGESDSAVVALLENLQREDLSYMEEAEGYSHLINQHHLTQEEVAARVGKNQSTIANKLRILRLPPLVKKILADNNLTERHARALLKLPDEQLQLKILKQICERGLNVKQSEELIDSAVSRLNPDAGAKKHKNGFFAGFSSVKIFINTIKQAVTLIKDAGMDAVLQENMGDDFVEYVIRIKK
ncbi:MAG: Nucleoid occlusion protein [Firmicutes bacterium ADurb.Bin193]|nr:MAG: Nucleoid occlusion protein [Firmicutes bacterium ADurb.Bin193]